MRSRALPRSGSPLPPLCRARKRIGESGIEKAARETVDRLEEQINELSRLIDDLRPASLERLGLGAALEALAEEYSARGDLGIDVEVEIAEKLSGEEERVDLPPRAGGAQQCGQACRGGQRQRLRPVDRPSGADRGAGRRAGASIQARSRRGRGLIGMRERIELLGGEIEVDSEPKRHPCLGKSPGASSPSLSRRFRRRR